LGTTSHRIYLFPAPSKEDLIDKMHQCFKALGYEAMEDGDDYEIALEVYETDGEAGFVSINQGGIEDEEGFTKTLSDSLSCDVLLTSIFDSDYLLLAYRSYQLGRSTIVGAGIREWEKGEIRQGEFNNLLELIADSAKKAGLNTIWGMHYASADERLYNMLRLLGYRGDPIPADINPFILLFKRPGDGSYELIREGLPQLRCHVKTLTVHNNGKEYLFIENSGGPSKGLTILLYGESISELIDIPEQCGQINLRGYLNPTIRHTLGNEPNRFSMSAGFYPYTSSEGVQALRADFPDIPIPEGLVIDRSRRYNYIPAYAEFEDYFRIIAQFEFAITKPIDVEKLDLAMQISPIENWGDGPINIYVDLILGDES